MVLAVLWIISSPNFFGSFYFKQFNKLWIEQIIEYFRDIIVKKWTLLHLYFFLGQLFNPFLERWFAFHHSRRLFFLETSYRCRTYYYGLFAWGVGKRFAFFLGFFILLRPMSLLNWRRLNSTCSHAHLHFMSSSSHVKPELFISVHWGGCNTNLNKELQIKECYSSLDLLSSKLS